MKRTKPADNSCKNAPGNHPRVSVALQGSSFGEFQQTHIDDDYNGNGRPGFVASMPIDLDGDGDRDVIVAGGHAMNVYECPDDPATSPWPRFTKFEFSDRGPSANGGVLFDVNGDERPDLITGWENVDGTFDMVWLESPADAIGGTWTKHVFDPVALSFPHDVILADVDNDGQADEIVIVTEERPYFNGVKWYDIPLADVFGTWPATRVFDNVTPANTGIAVGDVDGDNRNDIVYNRYWFRAPADPTTEFWPQTIYDPDETGTSNVAIADLNGDTRLDIIVAEGHSFVAPNDLGHIEWWASPENPLIDPWVRHQISARWLDNPENLAVVDMDGDGDLDVVTGELGHNNGWFDFGSNLIAYENVDILDNVWLEHVVADNINAAHQALVVDMDGDGTLDICSQGAGENFVDWFDNPATPGGGTALPPLPYNRLNINCVQDADCPGTAKCIDNSCYVPANRYVSIAPNAANNFQSARRIALDVNTNHQFDPAVDVDLGWMGPPQPRHALGGNPPENSPQWLSRITSTPHYMNWNALGGGGAAAHVGDCEVSPGQTYLVRAIAQGADESSPDGYTPALALPTVPSWGNVNLNQTVNLADAMDIVFGFQGVQTMPKVQLDLEGAGPWLNVPDFGIIGLGDVQRAVHGFQAQPYPFADPCSCVGLSPCPP